MTKAKALAILVSLGTVAAAVQEQLATSGVKVPAWFAGVLALVMLFSPQPHKEEQEKATKKEGDQ